MSPDQELPAPDQLLDLDPGRSEPIHAAVDATPENRQVALLLARSRVRDVDRLAAVLRGNPELPPFPVDARHAIRSRIRSDFDLDDALDTLERHGYIRRPASPVPAGAALPAPATTSTPRSSPADIGQLCQSVHSVKGGKLHGTPAVCLSYPLHPVHPVFVVPPPDS